MINLAKYNKRKLFFIAIVFSLLFFFIGLITLPNYGINWDEPVHFMRGQAYLHYFLTGKKDYSDLPKFKVYYQKENTLFYEPIGISKTAIRRSLYQNDQYDFNWFIKNDAGHPPINGILASFSNYIFFQKLGFLNDIDSYHVFNILTSSLLIGFIILWMGKQYSIFAGLISGISLFLYPLFLGESHFNLKDPPEAFFYSLCLIAFYEGITKKSLKWIILSSFAGGLALGTKFNIVFIPFILLPWIVLYLFSNRREIKANLKFIPFLFLIPAISLLILVAGWPFLWTNTLSNFLSIANYYKQIGNGSTFPDSRFVWIFGINVYPIEAVIFSTPLIILGLSFTGFISSFFKGFKEKNNTALFVAFWFLMPILRVTRPQAVIYGGIRQIMEYIPAMAILSGIGVFYLLKLVEKKLKISKIIVFQIVILLFFLPITIKLISIHPNEGIFFNSLIGGLSGAAEKNFPYWGESLGNPYRHGINWMNEHSKKNANLAITFGLGTNIQSILLRSDINFTNAYRWPDNSQGEYIIGLTNQNIFDNIYFSQYLNIFLNPIYEEKVDGVSIMKVWKNDPAHTKEQFLVPLPYLRGNSLTKKDTMLYVDLEKKVILRKIILDISENGCKKNGDAVTVDTSDNNVDWRNPNNDNLEAYILATDILDKNTFTYFFTGEKAQFIRINFQEKDSCLNNASGYHVYTVGKF